jgi:hypothetical protein
MATVYLARHETLGSLHALKVLRVDVPEIKRRLMAEGRVQSAIRHPNVVSVTDIVDGDVGVALVMEYVDGPALDEYQDERPLPIDEAVELFRGVVLGVGEAHSQGVVHRDLKSANILLHRTSNAGVIPKVTDFGLVKLFDGGGTRSGVTMGTPEYMSPEQVRDSANVDPRSDLWSLGVVLYEMLTGTVPFDGTDLLEIYNAIAKARYTPASGLRSEVPPHLDRLIADLLVVDPEERLFSCEAVLERLDEGAARATSLPPPADAAPVESPSRAPVLLGVGALGLAGVVFGALCLGVAAWWTAPPPAPSERSVALAIRGIDDGTPFAITHDDTTYANRRLVELGVHELGSSVEVAWAVGTDCGSCGTGGCPPWCLTGTRSWIVEPGEGAQQVPLVLDAPTPQRVTLTATAPLDRAFLGGAEVPVDGARVVLDGVPQGQHLVVGEIGECPADARGCADVCPAGCASVPVVVVVKGDAPREAQIGISPPAAPEPEPVATPEPVVAPRPADGWVTGLAFARFIDANPEWGRDAAVASGRADAGYLRDWTDGPARGPVTRVTWAAAMAYCAGRGGLRPLDAAPETWSSKVVRQEWRDAGGRPGWRRRDGETSTAAVANRSFPYTGFRCGR